MNRFRKLKAGSGEEAKRETAIKLYNLGVEYAKGSRVEKDRKKANSYFRQAAEIGLPEAQYNLGRAYFDGDGLEVDRKAAIEWYKKAAEQGFAQAQYNLGVIYQNGLGIKQDFDSAVQWYERAGKSGICISPIQSWNVIYNWSRRWQESETRDFVVAQGC